MENRSKKSLQKEHLTKNICLSHLGSSVLRIIEIGGMDILRMATIRVVDEHTKHSQSTNLEKSYGNGLWEIGLSNILERTNESE